MIKCTLDEDGCIDLQIVLRVINQINQEQAWAICYELAKLMQRLTPANCAPIESLAQIHLHKDGFVHEKSCSVLNTPVNSTTIQSTTINVTTTPSPPTTTRTTTQTTSDPNNNNNSPTTTTIITQQPTTQTTPPTPPITPELNEVLRRRPALNESELVASLGIALFWALDYGIPDDEERNLSRTMEYLIRQSQSKLSLEKISEICINRLPNATKSHANSHYMDVCKTLINDTIELSIFLEKIYTASIVLSDIALDDCLEKANHKCDISDEDLSSLGEPLASLRALRINDWARLWMQVIRELRQRGKFKQALSSVN